jgi:hypothetical protein
MKREDDYHVGGCGLDLDRRLENKENCKKPKEI